MYQLPIPSPLPITQLDWQKFMSMISRANAALGRYDELGNSHKINHHRLNLATNQQIRKIEHR